MPNQPPNNSESIDARPTSVAVGGVTRLEPVEDYPEGTAYHWKVTPPCDGDPGELVEKRDDHRVVCWKAPTVEGIYVVEAVVTPPEAEESITLQREIEVASGRVVFSEEQPLEVSFRRGDGDGPLEVSLRRSDVSETIDQPLWGVIQSSARRLSFANYAAAMNRIFCEPGGSRVIHGLLHEAGFVLSSAASPFPDMRSYKLLKAATEAFLMTSCGVDLADFDFSGVDPERFGFPRGTDVNDLWGRYLGPEGLEGVAPVVNDDGDTIETLPFLAAIRGKFPEFPVQQSQVAGFWGQDVDICFRLLQAKFSRPCLIELIWSYWHEEGGLVQTMNAISMRFQNRHGPVSRDPLASLEIDPLRPLNNLLWGYIQDEQHRLSVARRAYEYDHHYGITLYGKAVPKVQGADTRSRFLEAFHNLLTRAAVFYKEDDDTTMLADAFPVLNALREVHLLLTEGMHNQYGDLPWTARHEMLIQQWLLARPEFADFLPTRAMIAYPEPWMSRVDAMKKLQDWTDVSIRFFRDLGVYGEQLLLSIRFGNWSNVINRAQAANWARFWRQEVQWYIHAYQAVTGVDLSTEPADVRPAAERYLAPAVHLQRRMVEQRQGVPGAQQPIGRVTT
jgi:hypothetical protein